MEIQKNPTVYRIFTVLFTGYFASTYNLQVYTGGDENETCIILHRPRGIPNQMDSFAFI